MTQLHPPPSYYDPPTQSVPDESCSGCGSDLSDTAYVVRDEVLGECCVSAASRCDNGCARYTCECPCDECQARPCRCP